MCAWDYLSDSSANGSWQHMVLGSSETDPGHWSTGTLPFTLIIYLTRLTILHVGDAWAAVGMLRVLGTLQALRIRSKFPE